jgi:signal transduction histidine kinase
MTTHKAHVEPFPSQLRDFLRHRQSEIIATWTQRMHVRFPEKALSDSAIVDHLPKILGRIAEIVAAMPTGREVSVESLPRAHAIDRLARGFDLDQVVSEYGLLRRTILDIWQEQIGPAIDLAELRNLDGAFDDAIAQSAMRYAQARERLLKALDQISEAALSSTRDLETFLNALIRAMVDSTESVETAVVFLREGETLHLRAAVGFEEQLGKQFSLTIGEGFAGKVAAERRPMFLPNAAADSLVKSPVVHQQGVQALYGVPLLHQGDVIGVTIIGSRTALEFSDEDKLLFRTMASRATAIIVQAQLVEQVTRAETAQRFLAEASKQFAESLDYQTTLAKIAHLAVPAIADWCVVDLVEAGTIRRVSLAHRDPAQQRLAVELDQRYPTDVNATTGIPHVLRMGQPEFQFHVTDAQLAAAARDPEHLRLLRDLHIQSFIIAPIASRTHVLGAITLVTAESGRRYAEADLTVAEELSRRAATAIENARLYTDAQKAVQAREEVLAIVSHDLRNQLGVISLAGNLLALKAPTIKGAAKIQKPIETIQRTSNTMQHLLGDLLDMASIRAGRVSLERQRVEVGPMLLEAFENHQPLALAKGVNLRNDMAVEGIYVMCDRDRILQVLSNLLGNAIKFCTSGDTVSLRADKRVGEVLVSVADSGPGIRPEEQPSIFEPYRTIKRQGESGTGLGLYITKGLVEMHGGHIWVESEVGVGATFSFTLPCCA